MDPATNLFFSVNLAKVFSDDVDLVVKLCAVYNIFYLYLVFNRVGISEFEESFFLKTSSDDPTLSAKGFAFLNNSINFKLDDDVLISCTFKSPQTPHRDNLYVEIFPSGQVRSASQLYANSQVPSIL